MRGQSLRGGMEFSRREIVYTILKILYEISIDFQEEGERKILKNGIFPRWIFSQLRMHTNREFHFVNNGGNKLSSIEYWNR